MYYKLPKREYTSLANSLIRVYDSEQLPLLSKKRLTKTEPNKPFIYIGIDPWIIFLSESQGALPLEIFINNYACRFSPIKKLKNPYLPIVEGRTQVTIKREIISNLRKILSSKEEVDRDLAYLETVKYALDLTEKDLQYEIIDEINLKSLNYQGMILYLIDRIEVQLTFELQFFFDD